MHLCRLINRKQVTTQFVKNEFYTHFQVGLQQISTDERNIPRPTESGLSVPIIKEQPWNCLYPVACDDVGRSHEYK